MRRKRRQHHGGAGNSVVGHWAAPLVLAMLVLRSLIPAGFMLAPVNGGLAVVLCDADATVAMYGHAGHEMSGAPQGHDMAAMDADQPARAHGMSGDDMAMPDMAMADMSGHDISGHPGGHTRSDPTCPFAQSSGATPLPFLAPITPAIVSNHPVLPELVGQIHAHFGPTREQSPRGPPRPA